MKLDDSTIPDGLSGDLVKYIQDNPIGYAPFRVLRNLSGDGFLSEKDQIPLVTSVLFPFALVSYIIATRVKYLLLSLIADSNDPYESSSPDHVFVLGNSEKYRTYSLTAISSELIERQADSVLLCSPSAEDRRAEWENNGHTVITHRELHSNVPLRKIPVYIVRSMEVTKSVSEKSPYKTTLHEKYIACNYTLTEHIKRKSLEGLMEKDPCVHTYSPMPYLVENTKSENIFVYQHGIQWRNDETVGMATPFYTPLTYFLWGDIWIDNFKDIAHPDSRIFPTGSPWHNHLAESNTKKEPEFEVLLVSQSHAYTNTEKQKQYEEFVRKVVDFCREKNVKLRVKLHPNEPKSWYRERGLESYVAEFEDIDDALKRTQIAVTDTSSVFVESSVYGTPIVVADSTNTNISSLAPVQNVLFPADTEELPTALMDALSGNLPETDRSVVKIGGATERIISIVNSMC